MPIIHNFALPKAIGDLAIPAATDAFFIAFLASKDPQTNKPWCPDVVAALPTLESTFTGANKPQAAFVEVGQRPEWKDPKNAFRTEWKVNNVPALLRFEKTSEGVKEVGRLIEGEILDQERLEKLLLPSSK
ncbi:hypothetical protein MBLNU13_g06790t1 [Cladosporium sp. NU13]